MVAIGLTQLRVKYFHHALSDLKYAYIEDLNKLNSYEQSRTILYLF